MTQPTSPALLCAGILVADIFTPPLHALPVAGQLLATDDFLLATGGCAANVATSLAKLGVHTAVVGPVGDDFYGDFLTQTLAARGIDTSRIVRTAEAGTSKTVVLPVIGEDRRFIHTFGANAHLTTEHIAAAITEDTKILYVGGYLILPAIDGPALGKLFADAQARGIVTVLDVVVPGGAAIPADALSAVLPHTDLFLPNDEEAEALVGETDPAAQAQRFLEMGCKTAVVTQGSRGTLWMNSGNVYTAPVYPIEYVDGSGSGDAFAAGLLLGLAEGWDPARILRFASAIGGSACTKLGCTEGVFTRPEADAFIAGHPLAVDEAAR